MKKLTLAILLTTFSLSAFAQQKCAVPHAWIPPKNTSLFNKKGFLEDYSVFREKLLKAGWIPVPADDSSNPQFKEEDCIADRCMYTYKDKNNNQLYIEKPDDISLIDFTCAKR